MAIKHPTLGDPALVSLDSGGAKCRPLTRTALQGEAAPFNENFLQQLVESNPSVLPVRDILPTTVALVSLGREIAVDIGGQSGYIDNLLVTNEGRLVLVETKLWRNPESTREVIMQTLQYGMALSALSLKELEKKLPLNRLNGQTISEFFAAQPAGEFMVNDFEDALERNMRRGDMLYLIVADGIRVGVERITHWLNEGGSAPFKFGLVELRFYNMPDNALLVVPRTLLKTYEISRHVVVVDVKGPGAASAVVSVNDASKDAAGNNATSQRAVKVAGEPMTKERLLADISAKSGIDAASTAAQIFQCLEKLDLTTHGTSTRLHFGITMEESGFNSLITFEASSAWSVPSSRLIDLIGEDEFVAFKLRLNAIGANFFRPAEAVDPSKRDNGLTVKYSSLSGKEEALAQAISVTKDTVFALLS